MKTVWRHPVVIDGMEWGTFLRAEAWMESADIVDSPLRLFNCITTCICTSGTDIRRGSIFGRISQQCADACRRSDNAGSHASKDRRMNQVWWLEGFGLGLCSYQLWSINKWISCQYVGPTTSFERHHNSFLYRSSAWSFWCSCVVYTTVLNSLVLDELWTLSLGKIEIKRSV
jgi:hypothetical protein